MNRDQFHQYISNPDLLDSVSLPELEELVEEYPYFQAARILLVKNLKNLESIKFNRQLKYSAAFINNREYLFALLNGVHIDEDGSFIPDELTRIKNGKETTSDEDLLKLSDDPAKTDVYTDQLTDPVYDKSMYVKELEKFIPIADMDLLLFDHPHKEEETLEFDFGGDLPELETASSEDKPVEVKPRKVTSRDLIDEFIKSNPRMPKPSPAGEIKEDISLDSLGESDAFMTETLARIYQRQGYYYKAISAYEKLSLKYPEKSIYFASQIQKIKKLITNQ